MLVSEPRAGEALLTGAFDIGMASATRDEIGDSPDERSFVALCDAYLPTGGVAWGEDLDRILRGCAPERSLARLLASRKVLAFAWRREIWVPMAQFIPISLELKPSFQQVWSELVGLEEWDVAAWFARSNTWLAGRRPADLFDVDLRAVLDAARADRFISVGC